MYKREQLNEREVRFTIEEGERECAHAITEREPQSSLFTSLGPSYKPTFYFWNFWVEKDLRRQGYGIKMLDYIKRYYKGCTIVLQVDSCGSMTNSQLIAYYQRNGFKRVTPDWYLSGYPLMVMEL